MVTGGIGSMDSYTKAILDASLQEGLTAIDANLIDQSLLNNCRDVEYYHALRKHRPNFYVDGTEDYIEKASLITGQITRRLMWNYYSGDLEIVRADFDKDHRFVDISTEIITPLNRRHFKVFRNRMGEIWIQDLIMQKTMSGKDYVKATNVNPKFHSDALQAFSLIKPAGEEPPKLELIIDKENHLILPHAYDIYAENDFSKTILACMRLGKDEDQLRVQFDAAWKAMNPKQRCDIAAATGIPVMNILNDYYSTVALRSHILSYGITEAAKTWTYLMAMKLVWGVFLTRDSLLTGDALGSAYRLYAILSSTNLPILIDDSTQVAEKIRDILKSSGSTIRGKADQTFNPYAIKATLLTTAQHNVFLGGAISDEQAINRRLYTQPYNQRVESSRKGTYEALLDDVASGGLIYHVLRKYSARTLFDIVRYYKEVTGGNATLAGIMLGLGLLGKLSPEHTDSVEWEIETADSLVAAYNLILRDVARMEAGVGNSDNEAKTLATMIKIEEEEIFLNSAYLDWVNSSKSHPLAGKFRNLGALRELEPIFSAQLLKSEIYNKRKNKRVGGANGTFAVLPKNRVSNSSNINLTGNLTGIIIEYIDNKYSKSNVNVRHVRQDIVESFNLNQYIMRRTDGFKSNTSSSSTNVLDVRLASAPDSNKVLEIPTSPATGSRSPLPSGSSGAAAVSHHSAAETSPLGAGRETPPPPKLCRLCHTSTSTLVHDPRGEGGFICIDCLNEYQRKNEDEIYR